ncbi:MAG TPA: AAA family ATPase [Ottowia sp.]|uniref:ATP-binding protein n=1 Tax=Ottowia sp. TaxID=1898956 RepID=UPI002BF6F9D4|nr:AAA family ATPase [Ottowia sp.]HMN19960.1 AAA family ATPase [Ottowia sp.]
MTRRTTQSPDKASLLPSPGLERAPVLDLMCSHFVLTLAAQRGSSFNVRRDVNGLMALSGRHLVWPRAVLLRLREFLSRRCRDNELWRGHERLGDAEFLERHGTWRGPYEEGTLFFYLDEYAKDAPKDVLALLTATGQWLRHALKKQSTLVEKNIDALAKLLQLNQAERALLLYGTLARYQRELRSLLVEFKVSNAPEAYAAIAELAGVSATEVGEALRAGSRLERIGLVENLISEHSITDLADLMKVSEKLPPVLMREYRNRAELMAVFTRPASKSTLKAGDFAFVGDEVQVLVGLLRKAQRTQALGVNVLLYGPPGTGKTELAKVVAREAGLALFEVEYADRDGNSLSGRDRYRSMQIAQVFLKGSHEAALLFDEVEDVFPPISVDAAGLMARAEQQAFAGAAGHSVSGKAWVNQVLESNPVPTIWVTNRIEQIDPAFRRRFAYHLELKSPPPGAREQLVRRALDGVAVSDALVARLTERQGLTPAQIRTAVRFAELAHVEDTRGGAAFEALIERQLKNADAALGRSDGGAARRGRRPVTTYDLAMLNTESRFEVPRIVAALQARGHGTLCFHGAPGTGKTALAEYIAEQMEKPLIVRQASDLVSKFVGETEQNMAAMFRQASEEKAVLLLDEADSFLLDRRGAQRSYEVTEVNEMLQQMERHDGVFICTTNLMERIDQAALRRFAFKIRFKPLTGTQREQMFAAEALGGKAAQLSDDARRRLARLDQLCPGDFAAVKRQADILAAEFTAEEFLEQLEAEHRIKPEVREQRSIGFFG